MARGKVPLWTKRSLFAGSLLIPADLAPSPPRLRGGTEGMFAKHLCCKLSHSLHHSELSSSTPHVPCDPLIAPGREEISSSSPHVACEQLWLFQVKNKIRNSSKSRLQAGNPISAWGNMRNTFLTFCPLLQVGYARFCWYYPDRGRQAGSSPSPHLVNKT